jgi:4a-hydroxytetrahydrobiopterin dehydratase
MSARPVKLSEQEVESQLAQLPGWELVGGKLRRELRFTDFIEAFGCMSSLALVSEAKNHHPDWRNVYNRLEIELWTHDAGGITELDFAWARAANEICGRR